MIIKLIKLNNYNIFSGEHMFYFDKMSFIRGINGSGKTTLSLYAILFGLYGWSHKKIVESCTKGGESYSVELILDHQNVEYYIKREYPTKLTIKENNVEIELRTNAEKERYIINLFGDLNYFRKFRTIDKEEGINIVDEGLTSLKKTLLSIQEDLFNKIRINLQKKKAEREVYNRDAKVYTHYPSQKRLDIINKSIDECVNRLDTIQMDYIEIQASINNINRELGIIKGNSDYIENKKEKLQSLQYKYKCPTCYQIISDKIKSEVLGEFSISLCENADKRIKKEEEYKNAEEILTIIQRKKVFENFRLSKLEQLKFRLETVIKQKEYKYSKEDVLIVKKAIDELDKYSSYYLTTYIKNLEPIINSVLAKINFIIKFEIDDKNNFDFNLYKDGIKYSRKDLSTGQKLLLQIAFKIALLLERGETGLIIADEGMSGLDNDNLLHVIDLFSSLPFQLIIILHHIESLPPYIKTIDL